MALLDAGVETDQVACAQAYGSLTEGVHIAGYAFERACRNLEWLLEGTRWQQCGDFNDINAFLASLKIDQLRPTVDARVRIAKRIKELQPQVSNRAIGEVLGVGHSTINRDIGPSGPSGPRATAVTNTLAQNGGPNGPAPLSGEDAAKAVARAANKGAAQQEKKEHRAEREAELAGRIKEASASLIEGSKLYGVLYADPPWRFEPYSRETGMDRAADNHYPTMLNTDIAALKVPAADDCVLFLWATIPMLPDALEVLRAWGFAYKSQFVWVKDKIGPGYWAREQHELLLIGTRGAVPAPAPGEQYSSVIEAPRGEHSRKPFAVYEMIEEMFPTLPRLEMFSRGGASMGYPPGWDVWGAEASEVPEPLRRPQNGNGKKAAG